MSLFHGLSDENTGHPPIDGPPRAVEPDTVVVATVVGTVGRIDVTTRTRRRTGRGAVDAPAPSDPTSIALRTTENRRTIMTLADQTTQVVRLQNNDDVDAANLGW